MIFWVVTQVQSAPAFVRLRFGLTQNLAGAFFADDQQGAREGDEQGLRQGGSHVGGQRVVLAAVRLVG